MAADGRRRVETACLLALGGLWLVHTAANLWWLRADTRPPTYDAAGHAITCLTLADHVRAGEARAAARLLLTRDYPPLLYLAGMPAAWLSRTADALTATNAVFLAVLLASAYGIAREVAGPVAGLLAAGLLSFYPHVYGLSRQFMTDVPLAAMVALTIWLLVARPGPFDRPVRAVALGVALGLGLLAKTTFPQWVAAPALVAAASWRRRPAARSLLLLGLVAVPAVLLAGYWYARNLAAQIAFIRFQAVAAAAEGDPGIWSASSWAHYLWGAAEVQVMAPMLAAFALGTAATLASRRRRADRRVWVVVAWLAVPYVLLSLQPNKDVRYWLPALPAMAVLTAWGITALRGSGLRLAVAAVLAAWALVQFAGLTVGLRGLVLAADAPLPVAIRAGPALLVFYSESAHTTSPARAEDWRVDAMLRAIRGEIARGTSRPAAAGRRLQVVVVPDVPHFEPNAFVYQALADRVREVEIQRVSGLRVRQDAQQRLMDADFVITKTGDQGPPWAGPPAEAVRTELEDPRGPAGRLFAVLSEERLPDGSTARLHGRR